MRNSARIRPPSSWGTVAISRRTRKAGLSTPITAAFATTKDQSALFSSDISIFESGTSRTRQPSESRTCLTAPPPCGSLSRTRIPTCRGATVGLVPISHSIGATKNLGPNNQVDETYGAILASRTGGGFQGATQFESLRVTTDYRPTTRPTPTTYFWRPIPSQ